ncbi:MAG: hypothetical protein ACJ764_11995 [Solirubrobacteraceae bacterium]
MRPRLHGPPPEPLAVLLLPTKLEEFELAAHARDLLEIPRVVALEPPRWRRRKVLLGEDIAAVRQARRLRFPGTPHAVVLYDLRQYHLARALGAQHKAEVWYVRRSAESPPTGAVELQDADLVVLDQLACEVAAGIIVPGGPEEARADNTPLRERLVEVQVISAKPFVPGGGRIHHD